MKTAKVKLDNFHNNKGNPNYIAFDMMIGASNPDNDMSLDGDSLLVDNSISKNNDIIDNGEAIVANLGQFKVVQPGVLAGQLETL